MSAASPAAGHAGSRTVGDGPHSRTRGTAGRAIDRPALPAPDPGAACRDHLPADLRERPGAGPQGHPAAGLPVGLLADPHDHGHRGPHQHGLRHHRRAGHRAAALPGAQPPQRAHRPALRALAGHHRALAHPGLRQERLAGRPPGGPRDHRHLRAAGHDPGDALRLAALRRPRGHPRAARDRHRCGRGCVHAGGVALAHLLARHPAGHPLGRHLRRHPDHRALARGVRRRGRRLGQDRGQDGDAHDARGGALPGLRPGGRLRGLGHPRAHGHPRAARHAAPANPAASAAGVRRSLSRYRPPWSSRHGHHASATSRSASATSRSSIGSTSRSGTAR